MGKNQIEYLYMKNEKGETVVVVWSGKEILTIANYGQTTNRDIASIEKTAEVSGYQHMAYKELCVSMNDGEDFLNPEEAIAKYGYRQLEKHMTDQDPDACERLHDKRSEYKDLKDKRVFILAFGLTSDDIHITQ